MSCFRTIAPQGTPCKEYKVRNSVTNCLKEEAKEERLSASEAEKERMGGDEGKGGRRRRWKEVEEGKREKRKSEDGEQPWKPRAIEDARRERQA